MCGLFSTIVQTPYKEIPRNSNFYLHIKRTARHEKPHYLFIYVCTTDTVIMAPASDLLFSLVATIQEVFLF